MKFCKYCGTRLEDGQLCNCERAVNERNGIVSTVTSTPNVNQTTIVSNSVGATINPAPNNGGIDFNKLLKRVVNVIKHPISSLKEASNNNDFNSSLILAGVGILVITLLSLLVVKEFASSIMGLMGLGSLASGNMDSLLMGSGFGSVEIPYAKIFFGELIGLIAIFFAIGGLSYLVYDKFFKINVSFKQIVNVLANAVIFAVLGFAVSIVVMYLDVTLFIILLSVFIMVITIYFFKGMEVIAKVTSDKMFYAIVTVLAIYNFVILYLLPKILN